MGADSFVSPKTQESVTVTTVSAHVGVGYLALLHQYVELHPYAGLGLLYLGFTDGDYLSYAGAALSVRAGLTTRIRVHKYVSVTADLSLGSNTELPKVGGLKEGSLDAPIEPGVFQWSLGVTGHW